MLLMDRRRLILLGLALLCATQVCAKPTEKESSNDADYENDDGGGPDPEDEEEESNSSPSGPIQLLSESQSFKVKEGGSVLLPCKFLNTDNVAVQWSKDTVPLFLDESRLNAPDRYERLGDGTLKISNVQASDNSGDFRCEVLSKEDPKSLKHSLLVEKNSDEEKLVKLIPAAEVDIMQGETIKIGCEALPGLKYQRFVLSRRGERLHVNNAENGQGVFLVVHNATRHYAGDYQCLVETGDAKPIIKHITLKVKHAPEIEYEKEISHERSRDRAFYYTGLGQETNITCIVHSHPPVKRLHWFKDGQRLKTDGQRLIKSDPRKSYHVLTIKDTSKADLGQYHCLAVNDIGNSTGPTIHLTDTPSQPRFDSGRAVANSIVFEWKLVSYKPIVETELQIRKDDDSSKWKNLEDVKVISSEGKEHRVRGTISGIEAGKYEARLRARNDEEHSIDDKDVMWGPYSDNKKFDGEYKEGADAESVRDSAVKPALTMTMLLLTITPLAYLCL